MIGRRAGTSTQLLPPPPAATSSGGWEGAGRGPGQAVGAGSLGHLSSQGLRELADMLMLTLFVCLFPPSYTQHASSLKTLKDSCLSSQNGQFSQGN